MFKKIFLFLIISISEVSYADLIKTVEDCESMEMPWYINHIGASKIKGMGKKGVGSMIMVVDVSNNPFSIAGNITPLKDKIYYLDIDEKVKPFLIRSHLIKIILHIIMQLQ